ncbi:MAG: hypothetical protein HY395_00300 [Candidatus Doudnabacteria bacterium]|nr:hypothetical protein [Candidatus Doudnabacteria bacterium]
MFASIRKYKTDKRDEVLGLVEKNFVPMLSRGPGFVAYYLVETAPGEFTSVSLFESEEWAVQSNSMAEAWVAKNLQPLLTGELVTASGELIVHKTKK